VRTHVCEWPAVYLPLARRKYPGPSSEVIIRTPGELWLRPGLERLRQRAERAYRTFR